jgi:hypothetical protein
MSLFIQMTKSMLIDKKIFFIDLSYYKQMSEIIKMSVVAIKIRQLIKQILNPENTRIGMVINPP